LTSINRQHVVMLRTTCTDVNGQHVRVACTEVMSIQWLRSFSKPRSIQIDPSEILCLPNQI